MYTITSTVPTVYLDKRGIASKGFIVYFDLPEFNESHEVTVSSLDATTVDKAIKDIYTQRKALANLGKAPQK